MIYLSMPYSHPDPAVRAERYRLACWATAELLRDGLPVFSPVVHSHPLVEYGLGSDWEFWERFDRDYLSRCDDVVVVTIDGWKDSAGVQAEIALAEQLGKKVTYIDPDGILGWPTSAPVAAGPEG